MNRTGKSTVFEGEYPEELLIVIQMHFNKKLPRETIKECLQKNNNDLFLSLKDIHDQVHCQFVEE